MKATFLAASTSDTSDADKMAPSWLARNFPIARSECDVSANSTVLWSHIRSLLRAARYLTGKKIPGHWRMVVVEEVVEVVERKGSSGQCGRVVLHNARDVTNTGN